MNYKIMSIIVNLIVYNFFYKQIKKEKYFYNNKLKILYFF